MYGEVSLETAAHLTSAPWGERLPGECLSEPFHGSPTQGLGEGCSSCLSLQIWISQLTNFTIIKQMSWVYICVWWLCIHLCVYRSICVCVYGYTYLFPSLFTLVGQRLLPTMNCSIFNIVVFIQCFPQGSLKACGLLILLQQTNECFEQVSVKLVLEYAVSSRSQQQWCWTWLRGQKEDLRLQHCSVGNFNCNWERTQGIWNS